MGQHRKYPSDAKRNGIRSPWYWSVLDHFRRSRTGKNISLILAGVVVFATTYSLILPALTLEEDSLAEMPGLHLGQKAEVVEILDCQKEEHTHTDACFTDADGESNVVCEQEEHAHSGDCYHEKVIWVDQDADEKEIEEAAKEAGGVIADAIRDPEEDTSEQLPEKVSGSADAVKNSGEGADESPDGQEQSDNWAENIFSGQLENDAAGTDSSAGQIDAAEAGENAVVPGTEILQDMEETLTDTDTADREAVTNTDDVQKDAADSPVTKGEETGNAAGTREKIRQNGSIQENPGALDENTINPAVAEEASSGEWTYQGKDYQVHVQVSPEAHLPAGAQLSVQEISRGSVQYLSYTAIAKDRLSDPDAEIVNRRFFDICFLAGGQKVEPGAGVTVEITFDEVKDVREEQKLNVVHFAETKTELLENASSVTEKGQETIRFETGSFSVFGIVYTVDFHYEADGQDYEFSIPGGGAVTLSEVVRSAGLVDHETETGEMSAVNAEATVPSGTVLAPGSSAVNAEAPESESVDENASDNSSSTLNSGDLNTDANVTGTDGNSAIQSGEDTVVEETAPVEGADSAETTAYHQPEIRAFLDNVQKVEFSSPDLLWVGKAENTLTVGQLKETHGLDVQYSAELTDEQINEINAQTVEAGDWALLSLEAFTSDETLTITMKDGKVFKVKVTDAWMKTDYLSDSGDLYEVTVTYGEDAGIPDGSTLVVTEYDNTSEEYLAAWDSVIGKTESSTLDTVKGSVVGEAETYAAETEFVKDDPIEEKSGSFSLVVSGSREAEEKSEGIVIAENVEPYTVGMTAFDLSIYDAEGNSVEPEASVEVSILVKELPADVEKDVLESSLAVQHLNESTGELEVETVASVNEDLPGMIEIQEDSIQADFTVDSFSTYTITWGGGITGKGASSISSGNYIIYARDAYNGNYYALVPARNNNGSLQTVPLTYTNGVISYSGNTNLYWNVTVNNGSYRFSFQSGNTTYYMAAGTFGANGSVISRNSTSNYNNGANTTNFGQYDDHLHAAGDTFLRCYNGTFQFINDVSSGWQNRSQVFFAKTADTKTVTVHYGYLNGNSFVEFDSLPEGAQSSYGAPEMVGDQLNVRYDISGKDYVTTRINNPVNGTQISPMLQTEANSAAYWKYRILDTLNVNDGINAWQAFGTNDNDIYVIYRDTPTEKSYDDGGLTADDLAAPATNKDVQPNGDGTYDVSLSVTGTSNSKQNKTHANVVIVLDTSSSMSGTDTGVSGQTRLQAAQNAIYTLADQLFGFNTSDDPAAIEIAFVDFSHRVRNEMTKDTIYSGVVNGTDYSNFCSLIQGLNCNGGTNYDTAIEAANSVLWNDADPVYVIFVTDGDTVSRGYLEYDASGAADHAADWDGGTYYNGDSDATTAEYYARARSAAKIQLNKLLANTNNKFYSIGVFGNVQYLQELGGTYLGQANNEAAITNAFASIIGDLELNLGYKAVTIHDGITALTSTTLVNGVADQFRYKITRKDGTVQTFDSDAALQAKYSGIGTATYTASGSEKEVQWNLGKNYQLEDGVTYQLTFTVWPSQEAYDYLADFNNRVKNITVQDDSVKKQFFVEVDGSTYQYVKDKGWTTDIPAKEASSYITDTAMQGLINTAATLTHYIRTNTSASVDYTSVKTENGTVTETKTVTGAEIRDPNGKMVLDGTALKMQKAWNDSLATSELLELLTNNLNAEKTDTTYSVTLHMWQDKETSDQEEVHTATSANGFVIKPTVTIVDGKVTAATWPAQDVAISPGVMVESSAEKEQIYKDTTKYPRVTYGTRTYIILETGHTYNMTEDDIDLHFELNTDVYHPMVVNGVLKTVKFGTDASGNRIITEMSPDNTALTTLTATNDLKGGLDVMKFITTKDDASDTVNTDETFFTFKIKLQKSQTDTTPVYTTSDQFDEDGKTISGSLGFRIFAAPDIPDEATDVAKDQSSYVFDGLTYNANRNSSGEIYSYTARGTIPESGELTLKIRQSMLGGTETNRLDRIRIVNIPAGIYYTVEEIDLPEGYTLVKSESASGTTQANNQPTAKFWNKRTSLKVELLKVDELDNTKTLQDAEFKLYKEDGTTMAKDADGKTIGTIKTGSNGKVIIGKLLPGTYKLVETAAPTGYILMSSPITIEVTNEKVMFGQSSGNLIDASKNSDGSTWTVTATNTPAYELPATGGPGTILMCLAGTVLAEASLFGMLLWRRRRKAR